MSARQNFLIIISNGSAETADTVAEGQERGEEERDVVGSTERGRGSG